LMKTIEERILDRQLLKLIASMLRAGVMEDGEVRSAVTGTPQGALCSAEHNAPYEQRWVMRSVALSVLVRTVSGAERCT